MACFEVYKKLLEFLTRVSGTGINLVEIISNILENELQFKKEKFMELIILFALKPAN